MSQKEVNIVDVWWKCLQSGRAEWGKSLVSLDAEADKSLVRWTKEDEQREREGEMMCRRSER